MISNITGDIKKFLSELKADIPEVFRRSGVRASAPEKKSPGVPCQLNFSFLGKNPAITEESEIKLTVSIRKCNRREAVLIIKARVIRWAGIMGAGYGKISVKDQKSIWGSCSGRRNLNFNWRIAMAPSEVLDYVIIHELCHLAEMNHSPVFWKGVAKWCPDYRTHRSWLRKNSAELKKSSVFMFLDTLKSRAKMRY